MSVSPIIVENLKGGYNGTAVIHDCSMEVAQGEIVVIMGGSGSGKSTLLRHLIGLKEPMQGDIKLFGESLYKASVYQRMALLKQIGVAFQSGALMSSMSIAENIALPLREHTNLSDDLIKVITRIKLDFVNLLGKDDLLPSELSGGMLKRAAVARAIALDPKLTFMDEPSAGLDPVIAASLDHLIIQLKETLGMSIVVVTHEMESAFKIADRIIVLDRGYIIFSGTPKEIRKSSSQRIQNLINRVAEDDDFDAELYAQQLTGNLLNTA
jgi:phospholipid/cholesterol/gamma-HCH transport system ATP-binding protein